MHQLIDASDDRYFECFAFVISELTQGVVELDGRNYTPVPVMDEVGRIANTNGRENAVVLAQPVVYDYSNARRTRSCSFGQ